MAAMFMACSDEEDPGTGGNGGNQPTEVRKIRRIAEVYNDNPTDLICFEYADNTVKGVSYDYNYAGTLFKLTMENTKVEVMCQGTKSTSTLTLDQGRIKSGKCSTREADEIRFDYDSCYCTYENEYLKQMLIRNYYQTPYGSNNQPELYITDEQHDFVFTDGCLSEEKYTSKDRQENITRYTYSGNIRNDANADLLIFLMEYLTKGAKDIFYGDDILCLRLFGYLGHPSKSLPSGIKSSEHIWNLSYITDEDGYPTEIKIKEKDTNEESILKIYY